MAELIILIIGGAVIGGLIKLSRRKKSSLATSNEEKQCSACKMMIHGEASVCPYCRKKQPTSPVVLIVLAVLISIPIIIAMMSSINDKPSVSVGNEGVLDSGAERVPVAINQAAFDNYTKARVANDSEGITQLIIQGRILAVPKNTKVRVIDRETFTRKVRILEGEYKGMAGWVAYEYIH